MNINRAREPVRFRTIMPALAAVLSTSACSLSHLQVPEELGNAQPLAVSGRQGVLWNQRIRFGDYETDRIQRSATRGSEERGVFVERERFRQSYEFTLRQGGVDVARVTCDTRAHERGVNVLGVEVGPGRTASLACDVAPADDEAAPWKVDLVGEHDAELAGTYLSTDRAEDREYEIEGTRKIGGRDAVETTGYFVSRDGRPVMAVETANDGTVWFASGMGPNERDVLACLAAALLVLEDLDDQFDRDG